MTRDNAVLDAVTDGEVGGSRARTPEASVASRPASGALEAGVKKAALGGAAWTVIGYGGVQVLRFGSNLILTRLLVPRIFGLMALVNLFVIGLHMFSDFGILQAVVQSRRGEDPDFLNTAWTLQVVRGLGLWVCSGLIAWPVASFYGEPALAWLLPLAGATAAINGFNSTAIFMLNRRLARGRLVFLEVSRSAVSMGLVVGALLLLRLGRPAAGDVNPALRDWQLFALVMGNVAGSLYEAVVSYRLVPGLRHRFRWSRTASPELLHFGGWIFVSTACMFLASQADRLVIGKLSLNVLGVYHLAGSLANMPTVLMVALAGQLVFPLYSRLLQSDQDIGASFARIHQVLAGFGALLVTGLICTGPTLIHCLYDARYRDAGWFLQLLSVVAWFAMLQNAGERILVARGHTRCLALAHAAKLAALPALLFAGFRAGGLTGMILGVAVAEVGRYVAVAWFLRQEGFPVFACDGILSLLILGMAAVSLHGGPLLWGGLPKFARLAAETAAVLLMWAAVFLVWWSRQARPAEPLLRRAV
jgi:O-antigen/teichoic acid export membrane protein